MSTQVTPIDPTTPEGAAAAKRFLSTLDQIHAAILIRRATAAGQMCPAVEVPVPKRRKSRLSAAA